MRALAIVALSVGLMMVAACASAPSPSAGNSMAQTASGRSGQADALAPPRAAPGASQDSASKTSGSAAASAAAPAEASLPSLDRMVVSSVSLQLSVENAVSAARDAERIASRYGGFVGSSDVRDVETGRQASMTLRIPGASLMDALTDLRGIGKKVTNESLSTQDVTEEYTDVESNVRNLQATETQILALMDKASKMEEILTLQRELTNVRGQIERLEGRRRVLESRTSYADVSLRMTEPAAATTRAPWSLPDTLADAVSALSRFGQVFATVLVWALVFSPVYAAPLLVAWWVARQKGIRRTPPETV